ncbi:cwf18 pre-mRNA splicing factor-domain-containing protein [Morchella snyderi]|nr:cwf18 pre-mRNA splicing factor-domain-containing protein [Morchella snyderi]
MSSIASLDAAAAARKERLAKLNSLKRKQPTSTGTDTEIPDTPASEALSKSSSPSGVKDTSHLLSGRNYDIESRAPKMGFAQAPTEGVDTLEDLVEAIITKTKEQQLAEGKNDKAIDLFSLQPKKPNWDLKRDVDKKLEKLDMKTDVAIAKIIRARIEEAKKKKVENKEYGDEMDGVEGNLGAMVMEREREAENEREAAGEGDSDSEEL